ncbi:MAG: DUF445 family protein [Candidatus Brocadiia bacterium]
MTKGDWTALASVLLTAVGLAAWFGALPGWLAGLAYVGGAALVGCLTNRMAIKALFDPWPSRRLRLPYTGILERDRPQIEDAIARAVSERLMTPEVVSRAVRESGFTERLQEQAASLADSLSDAPADGQASAAEELADACLRRALGATRRALDGGDALHAAARRLAEALRRALNGPEFYWLVRERIEDVGGPLGRFGHATGMTDYDVLTYRVIDAVQEEVDVLLSGPGRLHELAAEWVAAAEEALESDERLAAAVRQAVAAELGVGVRLATARLTEWQAEGNPALRALVDALADSLDMEAVVRHGMARLSTEELKDVVLRHSRRHLAWLEVWGGVMGAAGGALMWIVSQLV